MRRSMTLLFGFAVYAVAATAAGAGATLERGVAAVGGSWSTTGSMHAARAMPVAVTLKNGKVLVAGGIDAHNHPIASAELYDPGTGKWSKTGPMNQPRSNGTMTLLANGKVLAAGGFTFSPPSGTSAEIYDPAAGKWTPTGSLTTYRVNHTATLLANGKVLVAGGTASDSETDLASAELYDPTTGKWTPTGTMSAPRALHMASRLASGQVLVSGGDHDPFFGAQGSAEFYDPNSGQWTPVGRMMTSRREHTSTLLADGTVLVTGGNYGDDLGGSGDPLSMTDRFDPTSGVWSPMGAMKVIHGGVPTVAGRADHTATLLTDGSVLVAGGFGNVNPTTFTVFQTAELFNAQSGAWALTGSMHVGRAQHAAVLLNDGRALVMGGSTVGPITATAEIFTPAVRRAVSPMFGASKGVVIGRLRAIPSRLAAAPSGMAAVPRRSALFTRRRLGNAVGKWTLTGSMHVARAAANGFPATLLPNGKVLVEGCDTQLGLGGVTAELWDPKTRKWAFTGSMHVPRCNHSAALLPDGRVLVAGGDAGGTWQFTAEIYDPTTGKWTMTGHMNSTRTLVSMLTLANGQPFMPAGAAVGTIPRDSADLYNPAQNTWTATPSLNISRYEYGSSVLLDGKVLVFGGISQDNLWTPTSELYDPSANAWTLEQSTIDQPFNGITLPTGDVLATIPSQIFHESNGTWTATKANMQIPRIEDTMTLLTSGLVLAAGGCTGCGSEGGNVAQSELYDPTSQTWTLDATMNVARSNQAAVRLKDGRVLVTGGLVGFTQLTSAEIYTPGR